jgi:serine/arginine repetitive matrix protein 1
MRKVNLQVIRPWVAKTVVELVGFEDEVVIEYAMGLLEDQSQPVNYSLLISPSTLISMP